MVVHGPVPPEPTARIRTLTVVLFVRPFSVVLVAFSGRLVVPFGPSTSYDEMVNELPFESGRAHRSFAEPSSAWARKFVGWVGGTWA